MKRFFKMAAGAVALVAALNSQAMAAASVVSSIPEANEVATEKMQQITLEFSEDLLSLVQITVIGPRGRLRTVLRLGQWDKKQVYASFFDVLRPGRYTVTWQVMSADKRRAQGTYAFSVK